MEQNTINPPGVDSICNEGERLQATIDALVAVLESVEWNDINVLKPICPACFSLRVIGHREHCPINAALKLAKEGQP